MNEDLLYQLALRLATFPNDPGVDNPRLIVGAVPQPLPINIPFPDASTILGSLIRSPRSLQILLDAPMSREVVHAFYERELSAQGWQVPDDDMRRHWGGFQHQGFNAVNFLHLEHSSGATVAIQISDGENGMSAVRINLNQDAQARRRRMHRDHQALPSLVPPKGAIQRSTSGSSGDDNANSTATLQLDTTRDIAALAKHYIDQLLQAGWTQIDGEQAGHAAWSSWKFRTTDNEEWRAAFYLFQLSDAPIQYHLSLHAEFQKIDPQGGWFT